MITYSGQLQLTQVVLCGLKHVVKTHLVHKQYSHEGDRHVQHELEFPPCWVVARDVDIVNSPSKSDTVMEIDRMPAPVVARSRDFRLHFHAQHIVTHVVMHVDDLRVAVREELNGHVWVQENYHDPVLSWNAGMCVHVHAQS